MSFRNKSHSSKMTDDHSESSYAFTELSLRSGRSERAHSVAIGLKETKNVNKIKVLFVLVLLLSAAGALGLYFYIRGQENEEFEEIFHLDALHALGAIGAYLEFTLETSDAFVAALISMAEETNQSWPFVTIPHWANKAGKAHRLTGSLYMKQYVYVEPHQRKEWEDYAASNSEWVEETLEAQHSDPSYHGNKTDRADDYENWDVIFGLEELERGDPGPTGTDSLGPYLPVWQSTPVLAFDPVYNLDLLSDWHHWITNCTGQGSDCNEYTTATDVVIKKRHAVVSEAHLIIGPDATPEEEQLIRAEAAHAAHYLPPHAEPLEPITDIYYPILPSSIDTYNHNADPDFDPQQQSFAGILATTLRWRDTLLEVLPEGENGLMVVFRNPCNPTFTYKLNGPEVEFLGPGDHHEPKWNYLEMSATHLELEQHVLHGHSYTGLPVDEDYCLWSFHVYPSQEMKDDHSSDSPKIFTLTAFFVFLVTSVVFVVYDCCVEKRQKLVLQAATENKNIVSSLFPKNVRERIYNNNLAGSRDATQVVADTYADCTVAFIDIAGFTSWSCVREPRQVFALLEALYEAYDELCEKRRVFKVETCADSFVAVTGLPNPQKDHASSMVKFACEARTKMKALVTKLELELGPGTADLKMRVGLHSGPVTAGVLRGQKARFQLFGDTVNMAHRMESTGVPNKIHVSAKTAQQLGREGKSHWVEEREDLVSFKGRGQLTTYFVKPQTIAQTESGFFSAPLDASTIGNDDINKYEAMVAYRQRLIDCNVAVLQEFLMNVVAHRRARTKGRSHGSNNHLMALDHMEYLASGNAGAKMIRDEVLDTIPLPTYKDQKSDKLGFLLIPDSWGKSVQLSPEVIDQLRIFVTAIAMKYPPNAFHGFEHCSHVIMSAKKLLQRVTGNSHEEEPTGMSSTKKKAAHNQTYGIRSDPVTQFAIVFSALVHDVEHPGISNGQMVKEGGMLAKKYDGKSVAEQHSVAVAWELLMEERFKDLQACIFMNLEECKRFRQILVNAVVTTDIFDKQLKEAREGRWEKTYGTEAKLDAEPEKRVIDRKATIVIELVIQASDVSHTMQHWHIYQRWNRKLLREQYTAYKAGRLEKNPIDGWYGGELWFFDNYIIPLATKMRDCQVFGVSCDEFLDFANQNRTEWAGKGKEIVAEWAQTLDEECEEELKRAKIAKAGFLQRSLQPGQSPMDYQPSKMDHPMARELSDSTRSTDKDDASVATAAFSV